MSFAWRFPSLLSSSNCFRRSAAAGGDEDGTQALVRVLETAATVATCTPGNVTEPLRRLPVRGVGTPRDRTRRGHAGKPIPRGGTEFFDFFERHAGKTLQAARLLRDMLEAPKDVERDAAQIKSIEHEGDEITHRTIEMLHQTFLTPIDRSDIHRVISRLDDILDLIDSTAERIWLYRLRDGGDPEAISLATVLIKAVPRFKRR